ncbi:MAG: hypothetical protein KAT16_11165, partial [Candidatus Heimdallarchaeota archaeon]|nr:hypothetical protein [Candidatus Heimdallarchaeota archaeon]
SCTPGTDPSQARPRTPFLYTLSRYIDLCAIEIKNYSLLSIFELKLKKGFETDSKLALYP